MTPPPAARRRRVVTAVVTVIGAILLALSLNAEPASAAFYVTTVALAAVWGLGAWASGPIPLGMGGRGARSLLAPIVVGAALAAVYVVGGLVVREVDALADAVNNALAYLRQGAGPLVVALTVANAVTEELFFRGALYAAVTARLAVPVTTAIYTLVVAASGNGMLALAALLLGAVTALQRRSSRGVLAPILTHVTWSVLMLIVLPPLFG